MRRGICIEKNERGDRRLQRQTLRWRQVCAWPSNWTQRAQRKCQRRARGNSAARRQNAARDRARARRPRMDFHSLTGAAASCGTLAGSQKGSKWMSLTSRAETDALARGLAGWLVCARVQASHQENFNRMHCGGAEDAGCEIAFHRCSVVHAHSFMSRHRSG